jgi:putative heme iron utilization protein
MSDVPQAGTAFGPDVVAAIMRHMNGDHADDNVLICRALGGQPDTERALMSGMDGEAIEFVAAVRGQDVLVRIPWSSPITERAQVRQEVVRMYNESCERLGVEPRPAQTH